MHSSHEDHEGLASGEGVSFLVVDAKSVQGMVCARIVLINSKSPDLEFSAKVDSWFKNGRNLPQNWEIQRT